MILTQQIQNYWRHDSAQLNQNMFENECRKIKWTICNWDCVLYDCGLGGHIKILKRPLPVANN